MITLRPYQDAAVAQTLSAIDRRPILTAPTGSGKTVMGVELLSRLATRTLWVVHRRELVMQAAERMRAIGINPGIVLAGHPWAHRAAVQVASIQTLCRREAPPADLIIIDECHHAVSASFKRMLELYPQARVVGLSATPFRLDGRGLGDIFGDLVIAATTAQLCDDGTLHAPTVYAPSTPNLKGVKIRHGDFVSNLLEMAMDKPALTGDIVEHYKRLGRGRTIVFAVGVEHSQHLAEAFNQAGIPAEHLDGTTPKGDRDLILERLRSGRIQVLCNCMVLTEGWDLPELETAVVARPTASLCLHLQMLGRIMRAAPGKAGCIVLDHAGNHLRHGFVTDPLEFTLEGVKKRKQKDDVAATVRVCPNCYAANEARSRVCIACQKPFPVKSREIDQEDGELKELRPPTWEEKVREWNRCLWAEKRPKQAWKNRFGYWPTVVANVLVDPRTATLAQRQAIYDELRATADSRGYDARWVEHQFRSKFGTVGVGVAT